MEMLAIFCFSLSRRAFVYYVNDVDWVLKIT